MRIGFAEDLALFLSAIFEEERCKGEDLDTLVRGSAVFDGGAFGNIEGIVESAQGWGMACL